MWKRWGEAYHENRVCHNQKDYNKLELQSIEAFKEKSILETGEMLIEMKKKCTAPESRHLPHRYLPKTTKKKDANSP